MLILHAGFDNGSLLLWGEAQAVAPPPGRRRARTTDQPKPYPFDAGEERLAAALTQAGLPVAALLKKKAGSVEAWLPTVRGQPVPSSSLITDLPSSLEGIDIVAWSVTTAVLEARQALLLLSSLGGRELLAPGLMVGKDLLFWGTALRFAGAVVVRQRFLPGVIQNEHGVHGRWSLCLTEAESQRLATLAAAMPGAARSMTLTGGRRPDSAPRQVVGNFVNWMADHLIRSAVLDNRQPPAIKPVRQTTRKKTSPPINLHDGWMQSLQAANDEIIAEGKQLAELMEQIASWQRPVTLTGSSPYRLCFRLEEPEEDGSQGWYVRFLLRSVLDPSLLIPTEEAWKTRGKQVSLFKKEGFNAQEYLLTALGQASPLDPLLQRGLRTTAPAGYALDTLESHRFLTESAFLLEENGFGVLLPNWWSGGKNRQRLRLRAKVKSPKMQGGGAITLNDVVHFDWAVALGGEELSYRELMALAKLKTPLVQVRGQWVEVNPEELQEALAFWKKRQEGSATVREILRMAIGAEQVSPTLELEAVQATGWVGELLDRLEGRKGLESLPLPAGFQGTLRPYQERGFAWLNFLGELGLGACLADDMGLGKTVQTLALVRRLRTAPILLVCPTSVMGNWQKEIARFTTGLNVLVHHGVGRHGPEAFRAEAVQHDLVISSYALLHRDQAHLQGVAWTGVILDEAQNIKNPETKQSKAARSLQAGFRIALTGTPVENNVGDLWSVMEFLNPGFLGGQSQFKKAFFVPIQTRRDADAISRLKRITGPFVLRRLKTDPTIISDLLDKLEMKVYCNLTREQATLYAAVVAEAQRQIEEADGIQRRGIILATLSKLKQVCNHPAQFLGEKASLQERSGKLTRLVEMLEEIRSLDERALIFTQFAEMGTLLKNHLQESTGEEKLFLHGALSKPNRDKLVERFQAPNGPRAFILSLKAGGTGLNLTQASHVFHFDRWWNPAVENQATDRAFRIGQTRNVQVHKFLCLGTLEEKIDEMIEAKRQVADGVVGSGENWLTEMSDDQLREIFALRREAFEDA